MLPLKAMNLNVIDTTTMYSSQRALYSSQKSPIYHTKEPYILLFNRAINATSEGHELEADFVEVDVCRILEHFVMFVIKKSPIFFSSKESYMPPLKATNLRLILLRSKFAGSSSKKSPIFFTKEPYILFLKRVVYVTSEGHELWADFVEVEVCWVIKHFVLIVIKCV